MVVPVYQSAWSIERTIKSVLNQRYDHFEVVIVDDGSTDELHQRIQHLVASDRRIRLVRQHNQGLAAARNRGFREAQAALVAPIDADDLWHPDFLASCKNALDAEAGAPFAYAYSFRIDEDDYLFPFVPPPSPPRHDLAGLLRFNSVGNGSAALFRKEAVLAAGGYDETMRKRGIHGAEDYKLILHLAHAATPVLVDRPLVAYRRVMAGMSLGDPDRQLRACLAVLDELRAAVPEIPDSLFRDARTSLITWLLPYFIRRGELGQTLPLMVRSYGVHPLWFLNGTVRRYHVAAVKGVARSVLDRIWKRSADRPHLSKVWFADEQPFSFLQPSDPPGRSA